MMPSIARAFRFTAIFFLLVTLPFAGLDALRAQTVEPATYDQLHYRFIGPVGNRVISVAGVPRDYRTYYAGAASGGLFKTEDGGAHWEPLFDGQPVSSIGSLAVAPSDPQIVWAGTGESFIRSNISIGNGIYKSMDGGKTWEHMGLDATGRIGRVVIHPRDPNIVYAAAMGHSYGPQPERGLYRTMDGGANWEQVLFVDENTGCSDVAMDPNNPRILLAGTWQLVIHTWGRESGGSGSGLFMSRDGGTTWTRLTGAGLPELPVGKVGVAIAKSDSRRMYALIETGDGVPWHGEKTESGELWRSDDGGENWKLVSYDRNLAGRTHYYSRMAIAPDDEDRVYFLAALFGVTRDGGTTIESLLRLERAWWGGGKASTREGRQAPGYDYHDMWIDPLDAERMIVAHDDGVAISVNRGKTWDRIQLPIAQMYHVAVDDEIPYNVYGNRQDGPSTRGPSNSRLPVGYLGAMGKGPIPRGMWHAVGGGESGFAIPDPEDNNIIWTTASGYGSLGGIVERYDERTRMLRQVEIWPEMTMGWVPADLKYRFNWTFPISISPHDHEKVYAGSQYVHQTTNRGQSWQVISPDLSRNDPSHLQISGGLTPDNIGVEYASLVFAIAESPLQAGLIWAGTNDGLVHVTRDGAKNWTDVTKNIPDLPEWGTVSNIEPSCYDAGTAYITVDLHQVNNRDPFVYKTSDYGKTWKLITNGIPHTVTSYAHCVREDPVRRGLLYLGTEGALYVSFDDGENWQPLQANLPHAPVHWLVVQEHFNDLVVGTYGRGFWILDDITPLQQLTQDVLGSAVHLFAPRPAYRFHAITSPISTSDDPNVGENPPYGGSLHYYLKEVPEGDVAITIHDGAGQTVRSLAGSNEVGINRIWWDLRYDASKEIKLRTSPLYAPEIKVGDKGWRPFPNQSRISILAPPGTYTVKLVVDGQEQTQDLVVEKDPNSPGSLIDIEAQTKMLFELKEDLERIVDMINGVELVRSQIQRLRELAEESPDANELVESTDELDGSLVAFEENLFQIKVTGRGQDMLRWPAQLAEKIAYLAAIVSVGDFPPTDQAVEVQKMLEDRIEILQAEFDGLMARDVAAFNRMLRDRDIGPILTKLP
jgi:photosystem II stability/assembly factor-like uncharacterized protein